MHKLLPVLSAYTLLLFGCGGQKLTPDVARDMVQRQVDTRNDIVQVSYEPMAQVVGQPSFQDFAAESGVSSDAGRTLQALLKAGYITQSTKDVPRVDVSGDYDGSMTDCYGVHLTIRMASWPSLTGEYRVKNNGCWPGPREGAPLEGTVTGEITPEYQLMLSFSPNMLGDWSRGELNMSIDNGLKLSGRVLGDRYQYPILVRGGDPRKTAHVKEYQYAFSPSYTRLVHVNGKSLEAGKVKIDGIDNLLLVTEASAEAAVRWHADFNDAAQTISGEKQRTGVGSALFRKQPDGEWILVEYKLQN